MLKLGLCAAGALLTVTCLGAAQANAASLVTFVSGKGTDSGDCSSPATPCRTFQFAINQTLPGGEVKALDPADYNPVSSSPVGNNIGVTINKSISITGVAGARIFAPNPGFFGQGIGVDIPGTNINVNLTNLIIEGRQTTSRPDGVGIFFHPQDTGTSSLTIKRCFLRYFAFGLSAEGKGAKFLVSDTVATNNIVAGITILGGQGTLDHVLVDLNEGGVSIGGAGADVTAIATTASNNTSPFGDTTTGFFAQDGAVLRLAHSTATKNVVGVQNAGATVISFGDNHIYGNGTNVVGTLTEIGTQ